MAFGAIVAPSVLEYVHDPIAVLRVCARLLQPGGTLLCTVPNMRHPVRWLFFFFFFFFFFFKKKKKILALDSYLTYLRVSRQRHPIRRWRAIAALAGLDTESNPAPGNSRHGALRMLLSRRPT